MACCKKGHVPHLLEACALWLQVIADMCYKSPGGEKLTVKGGGGGDG